MAMRALDLERTYSSEEFEALPDFDQRYELIKGKIVKKPVPGLEHCLIAKFIFRKLMLFDPEEKLGMMTSEVSTKLGPDYTPIPDLSFWMAQNRPKNTKKAAPVPDLAIEVWSPGDLKTKTDLDNARQKARSYTEAGAKMVWAINPGNKTVEVYRPDNSQPIILTGDQRLDGADLIPGFTIELNDLFNVS